MKKLIYTLLLLLVTFPAMAQSLFEQYERFLAEPRTYVCYRPDGKLKIDGKLNESSWKKAASTAPFVDISGEGFPTPKYETTAKMLWDDEYLYKTRMQNKSSRIFRTVEKSRNQNGVLLSPKARIMLDNKL